MRATERRPAHHPLLLFLVGPTASGKSDVAVELAARIGGEIVSADSMQVYRGLDIISAKPSAGQRSRVPHHLLDIAGPRERFDAARYALLAKAAIGTVLARGRVPIVAGGAGMYVRSIADGLFAGVGRDAALRGRLERAADAGGRAALHARLAEVDPEAASRIHPNDRRRIVRALEVFELSGRTISSLRREWMPDAERPEPGAPWFSRNLGAECVFIGMRRGAPDLSRRIEERARGMLAAGALGEARRILEICGETRGTIWQSLGLRELLGVIEGRSTPDEAAEAIAAATRAYAKRQRTWFNRDPRVLWFDVPPDETPAATAGRICGHVAGAAPGLLHRGGADGGAGEG